MPTIDKLCIIQNHTTKEARKLLSTLQLMGFFITVHALRMYINTIPILTIRTPSRYETMYIFSDMQEFGYIIMSRTNFCLGLKFVESPQR